MRKAITQTNYGPVFNHTSITSPDVINKYLTFIAELVDLNVFVGIVVYSQTCQIL